jgi:signal transduction histidine kinase
MKLELGFAWLAAMLPLLFSHYWHTQLQMTASLVLMLVCAWWLFAPLIRLVEKAKILEVENTKLQSLKDALMAKSEFLSRVSHELRSPLQGVVSALNNLEKRIIDDPDEAIQLSRIRRGAMTVNTQLRDLLTLARGDVGKIELNPMTFEAIELTLSVARETQTEADEKHLELRIETPQDPIFVVADPGRVDQVLTNLLTNAIRHTKQGSVLLRLHPYDEGKGCLRFEIIDTGPGIDKESRKTLFEPYTRFGELKSDSHGTGLGLAVVNTVVNLLGGKVDVTSELGQGATFTVEIPAERVRDEGNLTVGEGPSRVLVVDDFQEALDGISSVVRRQLGLECDTASNVANAANLLAARRYDLVLLDLDLPIKSGYDIAAETRRGNGPNKQTRIVSISAADVPEERRGAPFTSHLTKPITVQAIQRAIALPAPATAGMK